MASIEGVVGDKNSANGDGLIGVNLSSGTVLSLIVCGNSSNFLGFLRFFKISCF